VRAKPIQCCSKARLGIRPDVDSADASASELMNSKIGVDADVFDDQHTQAVQLQVARLSCLTLVGLIQATGIRCVPGTATSAWQTRFGVVLVRVTAGRGLNISASGQINLQRYCGSRRRGSAACDTGGYVPSRPAWRAGLPYHYITGAVAVDRRARTVRALHAGVRPAGPA
jgi:hypothetical protein